MTEPTYNLSALVKFPGDAEWKRISVQIDEAAATHLRSLDGLDAAIEMARLLDLPVAKNTHLEFGSPALHYEPPEQGIAP